MLFRIFTMAALAVGSFFSMGAAVEGLVYTWDGGGSDDDWNTAANWTSNTVPGAGDIVILDSSSLAGGYTVEIGGTASAFSLLIGDSVNSDEIRVVITNTNTNTIQTNGAGGPAALTISSQGVTNNSLRVLSGSVLENNSGGTDPAQIAINNGIGINNPFNRSRFEDGSTLIHNTPTSFAAFPGGAVAGGTTWDTGSLTFFGENAPSGVLLNGRTFGGLALNSPTPKTFFSSFPTAGNCIINGYFTVDPNVTVSSWGDDTSSITINNDITNNGDSLTFAGQAGASSGIHFGANLNISGSGQTKTSSDDADDITIESGFTLIVFGALIEGEANVVGDGSFTLASAAMMVVTDAAGIDGFLQNAGSKTLDAGAIYGFGSTTTPQVTGSLLPASVFGLLVDNTATTPTVTLTNSLTASAMVLLNGRLVTTASTGDLYVGSPSPLAVNRVNGWVAGNGFTWGLPSSSDTFAFPVGTDVAYSPVTVNQLGALGANDLYVRAVEGDHPNVNNAALTLNRYWKIVPGTLMGASFDFYYLETDVSGTESSYVLASWDGSAWTTDVLANHDTTNNIATSNFMGPFFSPDFTLAEPAGVPVTLSRFAAE